MPLLMVLAFSLYILFQLPESQSPPDPAPVEPAPAETTSEAPSETPE